MANNRMLNGKKITGAWDFSYRNLCIWANGKEYRMTSEELVRVLNAHTFHKTMKKKYEHLTMVK